MIKEFVKINKLLSDKTFAFINKRFGQIDFSEEYFYSKLNSFDKSSSRVLEMGGTHRPLFDKKDIMFYAGLDIDSKFDWTNFYHKYYNMSCTEPIGEKFDFIFSKYLLEHVDNNKKTFENIINNLNPSGKSVHIFPLGFHPYSVLTRLVSNSLQRKLIKLLRPHSESVGGYPVFFNLCNSSELEQFWGKVKNVQYEIKYFYGAEDYFSFFYPFFLFTILYNRVCYFFNLKILASNAVLTISKN